MPARVRLSRDHLVGTATLDHPEKRNALTEPMLGELAEGIRGLAEDGARVLVIRGADRTFCGGYDFTQLSACGDGAGYAEGAHPLMMALDAIEAFAGPTVAAINGHVVGGGCLLAMSCDLRYAVDGAKWSIPATRLGVVYPERGIRRLVALIGLGRAMEVLLVADPIEAATALRWGLVNAVDSPAEFDSRVADRLAELARRAPLAVQGVHEVVRRAVLPALDARTHAALDALTEAALLSEDVAEGLAALASKRAPEFKGQ